MGPAATTGGYEGDAVSLPGVLLETVARRPEGVAFLDQHAGSWRRTTWREVGEQLEWLTAGLLDAGIAVGDSVAIVADLSLNSVLADLAAQAAGAEVVVVPPSASDDVLERVLRDVEPKVVFAHDPEVVGRLTIRGINAHDTVNLDENAFDPTSMAWLGLLERGALLKHTRHDAVAERVASVAPDTPATVLHEGGSARQPVRAPHRSWLGQGRALAAAGVLRPDDVALDWLRLHDPWGRALVAAHVVSGSTLALVAPGTPLAEAFAAVQPTVFVAPRSYFAGLAPELLGYRPQGRPWTRQPDRVVSAALEVLDAGRRGDRVSGGTARRAREIDALRGFFGGRLRLAVCDGDTPPDTGRLLAATGIPVAGSLSTAVTSGPCTLDDLEQPRPGTVGRPLPDVELRVERDGVLSARTPALGRPTGEDVISPPGGWERLDLLGDLRDDGYVVVGIAGHPTPAGAELRTAVAGEPAAQQSPDQDSEPPADTEAGIAEASAAEGEESAEPSEPDQTSAQQETDEEPVPAEVSDESEEPAQQAPADDAEDEAPTDAPAETPTEAPGEATDEALTDPSGEGSDEAMDEARHEAPEVEPEAADEIPEPDTTGMTALEALLARRAHADRVAARATAATAGPPPPRSIPAFRRPPEPATSPEPVAAAETPAEATAETPAETPAVTAVETEAAAPGEPAGEASPGPHEPAPADDRLQARTVGTAPGDDASAIALEQQFVRACPPAARLVLDATRSVAVVVPDPDALVRWGKGQQLAATSAAAVAATADFHEFVADCLASLGSDVIDFAILDHPLAPGHCSREAVRADYAVLYQQLLGELPEHGASGSAVADPYATLEVEPEADETAIRTAYRRLAREVHPDVNPEPQARSRFEALTLAYDTLSNPESRRTVDSFAGELERFHLRRPGPRDRAQPGYDVTAPLLIDRIRARMGGSHDVKLSRFVPCSTCRASGLTEVSESVPCLDCSGTGHVQHLQRTPAGDLRTWRPCRPCHGVGRVVEHPCPDCEGEGRVSLPVALTVDLPARLAEEQRLLVPGQGDAGEVGGPAGDLHLQFTADRPDALS